MYVYMYYMAFQRALVQNSPNFLPCIQISHIATLCQTVKFLNPHAMAIWDSFNSHQYFRYTWYVQNYATSRKCDTTLQLYMVGK